MDRIQIKNIIATLIEDKTLYDAENINEETLLKEDIGMDSLDQMDICCEIERLFDIRMDDHLIRTARTVKDIVDIVVNLC